MLLGQKFNVNELPEDEKSGDYTPIPAGWYHGTIDAADLKTTKAGTGQYISITFKVEGPTHQNRLVFSMINIASPSQVAQNIGLQQLKKIMQAIGLADLEDTDQLIGGMIRAKVDIKPASGDYSAANTIKDYKSMSDSVPANASPAQASMPVGGQAQTVVADEDIPF